MSKDQERRMNECVACGHLYADPAPSSCDCCENTANEYRQWVARPVALEAKQAEPDTSCIVSDDELDKAFSGTNFGPNDHRGLLHQAVLKKSLNYHCGHTITEIMRELGLIRKSGEPTSKGIDMLRVAYRGLTTNGP